MAHRVPKPKRNAQIRRPLSAATPAASTSISQTDFTPFSQFTLAAPDSSDLRASSRLLEDAPALASGSEVPTFIAGPGATTFQPPISLAQLLADTRANPAPAWPIPDLLPPGLCLLAAKPHAGSPTLALQLALSIASHTPALDHFPASPGEALYLGLHETRATILARTQHLLGDEALPAHLSWSNTWLDWQEAGLADLSNWLTDHPQTRLLVIDSFSSLLPPGTPTRRAHSLLRQLNHLAHTHHICILILHSLARFSARDPFSAIPCSPLLLEICETLAVLEHDRSAERATLHLTGHTLSTRALSLSQETATGRWSLDTSSTHDPLLPATISQLPPFVDLFAQFTPRSLRDLASDETPFTTTQICESSVTPDLSTGLSRACNPVSSTSNTPCNASLNFSPQSPF